MHAFKTKAGTPFWGNNTLVLGVKLGVMRILIIFQDTYYVQPNQWKALAKTIFQLINRSILKNNYNKYYVRVPVAHPK